MKKKNRTEKKIPKKQQKKLLTIIPICIILLVMLVFLIGYIIGVSTNKQPNLEKLPVTPNKDITNNDIPNNNENNDQEEDNDEIELPREIYFLQDKNGKKIISNELDKNLKYLGKYTCEFVGCGNFSYLPSPSNEHIFLENNLVLIAEWTGEEYKTIVYNYQTNKIENTYDDALCSYGFSNNNFSVLVTKNNQIGILNSSGKLVHEIALDDWDYFTDSQVCDKISDYDETHKSKGYDGKNGVFSKDNKYGVVNMQTGEVIIDFKYEGIRLMYDGNYSIKENDKWYLVNNKLEKIIKTSHDEIYSFNDVILVGTNQSNNVVEYKLIDNLGNDLTNTVNVKSLDINTYYEVKPGKLNLGIFDSGIFTYDLSNKTLKFNSNY